MNLTVHNVYFCFSEVGCTISLRDGTRCKDVPAHTPTLFVAQQSDMVCSDPAAVVREIPNGLQLLHGQMMKEQAAGGLPAGFKRVSYLQSDGGQYIAIPEIKPSSQQTVNGIFYAPRQGVETKLLFGGRNDWMNAAIAMTVHTAAEQGGAIDSNNGFAQFGNEAIAYDSSAFLEKIINVSIGQSGAFINGEQVASFAVQTFASVNYYCLFTVRTGYAGDTDSRIFNGRCYGFNITQEGKYILNLIPCVNTLTGEPCMFDTVSKKPFYNSGSGDFTYPTATATYSRRRVLPDWGKLTENGLRRLYHAPSNYQGELYDYAIENGYKPIVEPEMPEEGYWSPRWTETEDEIVLEWVETEPPMEDFELPMPEDLTNNE